MNYINLYKDLPNLFPYAIEASPGSTIWHWYLDCPQANFDLHLDTSNELLKHHLDLYKHAYSYCPDCLDIEVESSTWASYSLAFTLENKANRLLSHIQSNKDLTTKEVWERVSQLDYLWTMLRQVSSDQAVLGWAFSLEKNLRQLASDIYSWNVSEKYLAIALDMLPLSLYTPTSACAGRWISLYHIPEHPGNIGQRLILAPYEELLKEKHREFVDLGTFPLSSDFIQALLSLDYNLSLEEKVTLSKLVIER